MKHYRFTFHIKNSGFKKLVKLAIPSLFSSSIVQINLLISATFATLFPTGSVTALNMADKTWQMPFGVVAQGIGIAILPTLSAKLATGDIKQYKAILFKALRIVILLTMPAAIGLMILNKEVVAAIFQFSSSFDPSYIEPTGRLLLFFSVALLFQSIVTVMNRAFYATNDTKTPLVCGILTIIINIILTVVFYFIFRIFEVIAIAYSLSSIFNCILLLKIMDVKVRGISLKKLSDFAVKALLASAMMAVVVYSLNIIPQPEGKLAELLILLLKSIIGAVIFFLGVFTLRMK